MQALLAKANVGTSTSDTTIATFSDVACLVPRLKMEIELSPSMLYLQGSSQVRARFNPHGPRMHLGCSRYMRRNPTRPNPNPPRSSTA